jgi:hypothetical protein
MSDRMSNADIEDVLSSIRRLVSDDLRPGHVPAAAPQPAPPVSRPAVPRLVLTSALRVSAEPPRAAMPEPVTKVDETPRDGLADRLAELEALMASQSPQFEDEFAPPAVLPASVDAASLFDAPDAPHAAAGPTPDPVPEAPYIDADPEPVARADGPSPETADYDVVSPADPEDDPTLLQDEDVLRALIRDVLREELQGVMGERVTRNLRKLIRAEIARALTARGIA